MPLAFACFLAGCAVGGGSDPDPVGGKHDAGSDTGRGADTSSRDDTASGDDTASTVDSGGSSDGVGDAESDTGVDTTDTATTDAVGGSPCSTLGTSDCTGAALSLGSISGDTGSPIKTASGSDSQFLRITITENDSSVFTAKDLHVRITLKSPAGENFDLFVYKGKAKGDGGGVECATASQSSTNVDPTDIVSFGWPDNHPIGGFDDTATLSIEVRAVTKTCDSSAKWELTVEGNK